MANQGGSSSALRDYRKGNWTVQETMVLIEAKKMDEERRMKRNIGESSDQQMTRNKPAELRWKWVEDYCWRKGCFRSQNQCNDKWDNLMRDFKKVRDYESKIVVVGDEEKDKNDDSKNKSYWKIEKSERKEKNLPSNMLFGIYEALVQVVERKCFRLVGCGSGSGGLSTNITTTQNIVLEGPTTTTSVQLLPTLPLPPPIQQQQIHPPVYSPPPITMLPLPPPQPPPPPAPLPPQKQPPPLHQQHYALPSSHPLPIVDSSDTSEYTDSQSKRKRKRRRKGDQGTSSTTSDTSLTDFGSAICKSASIIAEALQAGEEREERRHKDILSLHERRLQTEESKAEINRQGFNGLADAINNLSKSILTLATRKNNP